MDLNPIGTPPTRWARWCPLCQAWKTQYGSRRCIDCGTAVVRQSKPAPAPKPGELRPGVIAEFHDPRDIPPGTFAELRERLRVKFNEKHGL